MYQHSFFFLNANINFFMFSYELLYLSCIHICARVYISLSLSGKYMGTFLFIKYRSLVVLYCLNKKWKWKGFIEILFYMYLKIHIVPLLTCTNDSINVFNPAFCAVPPSTRMSNVLLQYTVLILISTCVYKYIPL